MPEYDDQMQATEAEIPGLQSIINQIKVGNTKEALDAIEALDKTVIDKVILKEPFHESDSILTTALECDAFEIINKLIKKKCNLLAVDRTDNPMAKAMDDALNFWFKKAVVFRTGDANATANLYNIGRTLFDASQKTLLDQTIFQLIQQWILPKDLPVILYELLGAEKFIQFLFCGEDRSIYLEHIIVKGRVPAFRECLNIFTKNGIKITQDTLFKFFLTGLSELKHPKDNFYELIQEYSEALHKNIIPTEIKSLSERELKTLLEPQITSPMNGFPDTEYWRLFVDGKKQITISEHGWSGYEDREPGCLQKMYDAFMYVREDLKTKPLTYEMTDEIHRIATGHFQKSVPKNFRNSLSSLTGLVNVLPVLVSGGTVGSLTYQGFLEITKAPYANWYRLKNGTGFKGTLESATVVAVFSDTDCKNEQETISTIKEMIEEYHKNLDLATKANDRTKQLQCIIKLASDYARFHPYNDGNNRTAVCILNRELQKHGFPLTILSDPNELEGHSQAELFTKVCQGMQNFLAVKADQPYPGSKTTTEFTQEHGSPPPIKLAELTIKIRFR